MKSHIGGSQIGVIIIMTAPLAVLGTLMDGMKNGANGTAGAGNLMGIGRI